MQLKDVPAPLRPYLFHRLDLQDTDKSQARCECPFCGKEKFFISADKGLYNCRVCGEKGNSVSFLKAIWKMGDEQTKDYKLLREERKLLLDDTLIAWGVARSVLDKTWLVPGYSPERKLAQLYRYIRMKEGKKALLATPEHKHAIHGMSNWDATKPDVFVCEGPWDGMALYEVLKATKKTSSGLAFTASSENNLLATANVIAFPGCSTFFETWAPLMGGKRVSFLFDNDHPSGVNGKTTQPGYDGMKRAANTLALCPEQPSEVNYLEWGPAGYDKDLPSGHDVRDFLSDGGHDFPSRIERLQTLMGKIKPIPNDWVGAGLRKGSTKAEPKECKSYRQLQQAWKKALKWTDGLDRALTAMLASIVSTGLPGDQLWFKIVGPASCLGGATPIFDPVDKTTKTVHERFLEGKKFWVYTIHDGNQIGLAQALPPEQYPKRAIWKLTFNSGKVLHVTDGHQIWAGGEDYLPVYEAFKPKAKLEFPTLQFAPPPDLCQVGQGNPEIRSEKQNSKGGIQQISVKTSGILFGNTHNLEYDRVKSIKFYEWAEYYDFHVPETNNYWAEGFFHHNCGKSTLCEAVSVSNHIRALSTLRGFHSGFKTDREGKEDNSLINQLRDKTLVLKDGDTLLSSPNLDQILSEARDVYDRVSRTNYRNAMGKDYQGINMTWLLCGTSSLRRLDSSELGQRFLDCVIMEEISPELETEVNRRRLNSLFSSLLPQDGDEPTGMDGESSSQMEAKRLTGGYIDHMRKHVRNLKSKMIRPSEDTLNLLDALGKFVANMRARPSLQQDEECYRELSTRLCSQMAIFAFCTALVLNKKSIDDPMVLDRVRRVALDTARGKMMVVVDKLAEFPEGLEASQLATFIGETTQEAKKRLIFLRKIKAVELFSPAPIKNYRPRPRYRMREMMRDCHRAANTPLHVAEV